MQANPGLDPLTYFGLQMSHASIGLTTVIMSRPISFGVIYLDFGI